MEIALASMITVAIGVPVIYRRSVIIVRFGLRHCEYAALALLLCLAHIAQAQPVLGEPGTPAGSAPGGVALYDISLYSSYYSPSLYSGQGASADYDVSLGGSARVGWRRSRSRSNLAVTYTASYMRDLNLTSVSALNHAFSFNGSRNLSPHWNFTLSTTAEVMNSSEFLFRQNLFSQIADTASTPDELTAAILSGTTFSNPELAALLTSSPILESPARQVFFGDRALNASLQTGLAYNKSRLTISLTAGASRIQPLSPGGSLTSTQPSTLVPAATSGQAGVNLSYSLSPRTQVGISVASSRSFTRFEDAYISSVTANLGRRLSRRWSVQLTGGTGFFIAPRQTFELPSGPQYMVGGSTAYTAGQHTLLFSANRSLMDSYGFGASSSLNGTAGWSWGRRGRAWRVLGSFTAQQIHSLAFPDVNAWTGTVGFSQQLSRQATFQIAYAYLRTQDHFAGLPGNLTTHAIRTSIAWTPGVPLR